MVRDVDEYSLLLHSKEGVTQGGILAMIYYATGILLIIREIRTAHPQFTQLWYMDNAGAGGKS